eukprot:14952688-Alexandrium_andersonii.AAC.1
MLIPELSGALPGPARLCGALRGPAGDPPPQHNAPPLPRQWSNLPFQGRRLRGPHRASWGAASWRPKLRCGSTFAHSAAP